jgi:hypothetical protein
MLFFVVLVSGILGQSLSVGSSRLNTFPPANPTVSVNAIGGMLMRARQVECTSFAVSRIPVAIPANSPFFVSCGTFEATLASPDTGASALWSIDVSACKGESTVSLEFKDLPNSGIIELLLSDGSKFLKSETSRVFINLKDVALNLRQTGRHTITSTHTTFGYTGTSSLTVSSVQIPSGSTSVSFGIDVQNMAESYVVVVQNAVAGTTYNIAVSGTGTCSDAFNNGFTSIDFLKSSVSATLTTTFTKTCATAVASPVTQTTTATSGQLVTFACTNEVLDLATRKRCIS